MLFNHTDLNGSGKISTYLILALILLLLSAGGAFLYLRLLSPVNTAADLSQSGIPTSAPTLTSVPISASPSAKLTPSATPSAKVTLKPSPTVTPKISITPQLTPTPTTSTSTPAFTILKSDTNKFEVPYSSSRTLYQDKEGTGDRYTLYLSQGNFAIHVGPDWSWTHSSRQLSSAFTIASKNTFVYEISTQKLVDFEANGLKYTIQCVHNNVDSLKKECDQLLADFKLN